MNPRFIFVFAAVITAVCGSVWAQQNDETTSEAATIRQVSGVQFALPADWPIERRNGATGPIPIEEYIGLKFAKLEERVTLLEQKLDEKKDDTEKSSKPEKNRLQSYEVQTQPPAEGKV